MSTINPITRQVLENLTKRLKGCTLDNAYGLFCLRDQDGSALTPYRPKRACADLIQAVINGVQHERNTRQN